MSTDARAFDDEHVPRREMVLHRHTEIDRVTDALRPAIENRPADNVHLFGPSGVGKTESRQKAISKLTPHRRVLYETVDEVGPVDQGELYDVYEDRVESATSLRTVRKYLQKREQYHILTVTQDGPSKVYSVEP